jgi:hypothetical protein
MRLISSLTVLFLSLVCLIPGAAFADTLTLTGVAGVATAGQDVYPYVFEVTNSGGSQASVFLSCINFDRDITIGESWEVDTLALSAVNPAQTYDGESGISLLEDAWLFNQYGSAVGTDSEIQFAIWSIMDPSDINASNPAYNGPNAFDATAQALAAEAIAEVTGSDPPPSSDFAADIAYLPDPGGAATWTDGEPQISMGLSLVAEPDSLFLLGSGIAALAVVGIAIHRRRMAERIPGPACLSAD